MHNQFEAVNLLKYATVENAPRYRAIMRFLLEQHEKFKYYSKTEEILQYLKENNHVDEHYNEDVLYSDLKSLEQYENVISRQDKEVVYTIEEFKKKRLKFQITQAGAEVESVLRRLDELEDALTGALESRQFERILKAIFELKEIDIPNETNENLYEKWNSLMGILDTLKRNSTNYLAHLKSEKAEQLFKTEEFLVYKERFTDYLTKFILGMKKNRHRISKTINQIKPSFIDNYVDSLVLYFSSIPSIDGKKFNAENTRRIHMEKWVELKNWFVKNSDEECDVDVLMKETEKSIQILSRYALRLSEIKGNNRNRKEDYRTLASLFNACNDIQEAHELAACCFGVPRTKHIYGYEKITDTQSEEIWDQISPKMILTAPRVRDYSRAKQTKSYVKMSETEKQNAIEEVLRKREEEKQIIEGLIVDNHLVLKELGVIQPFVRKVILGWITKSMQNKTKSGTTEFGRKFDFKLTSKEKVKLTCEDGVLTIPDIVFEFKE
jgi:uncharacterized protein (TIGR02677 family)